MNRFSFSKWFLAESELSEQLRAYHGGALFERFSLDFIGQGEGRASTMKPALGPGIYFSDCKEIAELYVKYATSEAAIHEVILSTNNLHNIDGPNPEFGRILSDVIEKIGLDKKDPEFRYYGFYRGIFKLYGIKKAATLFVQNGIDGVYEKLPSGCLEISIINPEVIKTISVTKVNKHDY